jgi:hypothetical protein
MPSPPYRPQCVRLVSEERYGQAHRQGDCRTVSAGKLRAGRGLSARAVQKGATVAAFPVFGPTLRAAARTRSSTPNSQRPTTNHSQPSTSNSQRLSNRDLRGNSNGVALGMQLDMETTDWNQKKPYYLSERLFEFCCLVIRLVQYLHTRGPVAIKLSEQIPSSKRATNSFGLSPP